MRRLRRTVASILVVTATCVTTWASPAAAFPTLVITPSPAMPGDPLTVDMTEVDSCIAKPSVISAAALIGSPTGHEQVGAQVPNGSHSVTFRIPFDLEDGTYPVQFHCARALAPDVHLTSSLVVGNPEWGLLRVTTTPAVPAGIRVDGVVRDSWGLDWAKFPTGPHQICFDDVIGFTTPGCQMVDVPAGGTVAIAGAYAPSGYLRVLTSPPSPSTIVVDGIARNDWGLWTEVPAGSHEVCFGDVLGADAPACRTVAVTAGTTTTTTGTFTSNPSGPGPVMPHGFLRATTSPATEAMIYLDGNARTTWGLDWLELPPGDHTVCFGAVSGLIGPDTCSVVSIAAGATSTIEGTYLISPQLHVTTSPPTAGTVFINAKRADDFSVWTPKPPGTYRVCFGEVPGFRQPDCNTVTLDTPGTTTSVTGTYLPE